MQPIPYSDLNEVLTQFCAGVKDVLGADLIGIYLQGSFAVGDFDEHSDLDFVVVVQKELSSKQIETLQVFHHQIFQLDSKWAQHLEGSYFPAEILKNLPKPGQQLWYLDNGANQLVRSDHCNTLVVRWTLREKGVSLFGPLPGTLVEPISKEWLRAEIFETLNGWGSEILANPSAYNNWFYQSFIVLNYCRMLRDLHAGQVGSKRQGAAWAKTNLAPVWADLIDRSWEGRPNPAEKVKQPADPEDFTRTLQFLSLVMEKSRLYYCQK